VEIGLAGNPAGFNLSVFSEVCRMRKTLDFTQNGLAWKANSSKGAGN
jgi:hypothetical protein